MILSWRSTLGLYEEFRKPTSTRFRSGLLQFGFVDYSLAEGILSTPLILTAGNNAIAHCGDSERAVALELGLGLG